MEDVLRPLRGYVQPAFAARALNLSPLDLHGARLPQGAGDEEPWLVVGIERAEALARAAYAPDRLRDLVLRQRFDGVVAALSGERVRARFFRDEGEVAPSPGALHALAAWLAAETPVDVLVEHAGGRTRVVARDGRVRIVPAQP